MKIPKYLKQALNETGLPWEAIPRTKHTQIKLAGELVLTIQTNTTRHEGGGKHTRNNINGIKKAAIRLKGKAS